MGVIMKSKTIVNIKKLISVLIFTILISSPLTLNLLNNAVFAANQNVSNFDQLKNAVENANDGDVVILTSDITIPNSATAPEANYRCVLNCSKNIFQGLILFFVWIACSGRCSV